MAKLSRVEDCLLCEQSPCECSGRKKSRSKKTSVQDKQAPAAVPMDRAGVPSMRDKMKAAAAAAPQPTSTHSARRTRQSEGAWLSNGSAQPPQPPKNLDQDAVLAVAVYNLRELLHPEDAQRWGAVISTKPTPKQQAEFWRAGREDHAAGTA